MYGSVSRWRVKDGKQDELRLLMEEVTREQPPGSRALYVYQANSDPREHWVVGVWDSREAYTSNSATPEQDSRFQRLRALMETDPEWHDGEIVVSN